MFNLLIGVVIGVLGMFIYQMATSEVEEVQVKKFVKQMKSATLVEKERLKESIKQLIDKI